MAGLKRTRKWKGDGKLALEHAAEVYDVDIKEILEDSREQEVVQARRYAWAILRAQGYSFPKIAEMSGGYDHSSILQALNCLSESTLRRAAIRAQQTARDGQREVLHRAHVARWNGTATEVDIALAEAHFQAIRDVAKARLGGVQ